LLLFEVEHGAINHRGLRGSPQHTAVEMSGDKGRARVLNRTAKREERKKEEKEEPENTRAVLEKAEGGVGGEMRGSKDLNRKESARHSRPGS